MLRASPGHWKHAGGKEGPRKAAEGPASQPGLAHAASHKSSSDCQPVKAKPFSALICSLGHQGGRRSRTGESSGAVRSTGVHQPWQASSSRPVSEQQTQRPSRFASVLLFFDSYCISSLRMSLLPGHGLKRSFRSNDFPGATPLSDAYSIFSLACLLTYLLLFCSFDSVPRRISRWGCRHRTNPYR